MIEYLGTIRLYKFREDLCLFPYCFSLDTVSLIFILTESFFEEFISIFFNLRITEAFIEEFTPIVL